MMKKQGTQQSRWLWPIIKSDPNTLAVLPSHCLAQLLMSALDTSEQSDANKALLYERLPANFVTTNPHPQTP